MKDYEHKKFENRMKKKRFIFVCMLISNNTISRIVHKNKNKFSLFRKLAEKSKVSENQKQKNKEENGRLILDCVSSK